MIKKIILPLVLFSVAHQVSADGYFYIYQDKQGRTFIEDSISADHAKYGYRIVNSQGTTIKVIASTIEQKRKEEKRRKRLEAESARRSEREADEFLLHSFLDEEDIRESGNKKIMAIQAQIETTNNHIQAFEENLTQLEAQIHKADLNGLEVTQEEVDAIKRIQDSIKQNKLFVVRKIVQQQNIREQYIGYMKRFNELKDEN